MAKSLAHNQAHLLRNLLEGKTSPSRLTPAMAVALASLGALDLKEGKLVVTDKAKRILVRNDKRADQLSCDSEVARVLQNEILIEKGIVTQHRQVWEAVGLERFTRTQVLNSLRSLRAGGFLKSFKPSGNNFQVFWARKEVHPVPAFEVNAAK